MKSPLHPRPSGDRRIARLFMGALESAGHHVELASELRAWEGRGNAGDQAAIRSRAEDEATRLVEDYRRRSDEEKPDCWFTYHLYHKAPDWIGPAVAGALEIPYVVAEASIAGKQAGGPWHEGHQQAVYAVGQAARVFTLNSEDTGGVQPLLRTANALVRVRPFMESPAPLGMSRHAARQQVGARRQIDPDRYWLLCVAMMRRDSKLQSYRLLANTLGALERGDWQLLVVGDGPAEQEVMDLFHGFDPGQVHFFGRRDSDFIHTLMQCSDLFVWPACNEAFGMAVLEASACGLPVVAGRSGGIGDIVDDGTTGVLVDAVDGPAMARAIEDLLARPDRLDVMAQRAREVFDQRHRLAEAASVIDTALKEAVAFTPPSG